MSHNSNHIKKTLASDIELNTEVIAQKCYQCGKCTAGCPISGEMDYPPSMMLRMLQTEDPANEEKILRSHSIWLCLTCEMCLCRCPMEIDIPSMMDYLRQRSMSEKKVNRKAKNIIAFHKSFLNSIKLTGRLYEVGLVVDYKRRSFKLMQDINVAPKMLLKGKLPLLPESIRGVSKIRKIFKRTCKQ